MRRLLPFGVLLALGLGCAGLEELAGDWTGSDGSAGDDDDEASDDDDDDDEAGDDDDETPEGRKLQQATPDCTVDMTDVLVGLPGYGASRKEEAKSPVKVYKKPKGSVLADLTPKGMIPPDKERYCAGISGDPACIFVPVALETKGLPVYTVRNNFALVGLGRGGNILDDGRCQRRAWIELGDGLTLKPVSELVVGEMSYLRPGMSGQLFDGPAGDESEELDTPSDNLPMRVLRSKQVDERWWLEVEVLDKSPCDGKSKVTASGWMPLHGADGRMQFWFYTDC